MSTYLSINIAIIAIPLVLSFDQRVRFYKKWKYALPAICLPGIIFIVWDIVFTKRGIWNFNPEHLQGIEVINLPIEEILFFITVPYSSIFTYETIKIYYPKLNPNLLSKYSSLLLITVLLVIGMLNLYKSYTLITFMFTAAVLIFFQFIIKSKIMGRFYIAYCLILIPFMIFNGLLTGSLLDSPVVIYNNNENLGIRLVTIPIEDIFYGLSLIALNINLFEVFRNNN